MPIITASAPILLVADVEVSANWYRDKLGFTISRFNGDPYDFAIVERDGHYLMFNKADKERIMPNWKVADKTCNVFFWVDDVETLYRQFITQGATIDYELYNTNWGGKEFGVNDPDGYDIAFAQIDKGD